MIYSPYLVCHPLIIWTLSPFSSSMLGLHECISKAVSVVVRFCSIIKSSFSPPLISSSPIISCLLPLFYQHIVIFNMNLESSDRQYVSYLYETSELIYFRFTSTQENRYETSSSWSLQLFTVGRIAAVQFKIRFLISGLNRSDGALTRT